MAFTSHLNSARWHWPTAASIAAACVAAACVIGVALPRTYRAETQLYVTVQADPGQGGSTQQRIGSYQELLRTPVVLQPVIDVLGLRTTPAELADHVEVTSPSETTLLDVIVSDHDPARARDVANALATQFPEVVDRLETPVGRATSPVKVAVTKPAVLPRTTWAVPLLTAAALGLLAGLVLGIPGALLSPRRGRATRRGAPARQRVDPDAPAAEPGDPAPFAVGEPASPAAAAEPAGHGHSSPLAELPVLGPVIDLNGAPGTVADLAVLLRHHDHDPFWGSLVVTGDHAGTAALACELAIALARTGEYLVLIDGDPRRPQVAAQLGLCDGPGLSSVLLGEVGLDAALQTWRPGVPLEVLTAGEVARSAGDLLAPDGLADVVLQLRDTGRTVMVVAPLLPPADAAGLGRAVDAALLVTSRSSTSDAHLDEVCDVLRTGGARLLGLVVTETDDAVPPAGHRAAWPPPTPLSGTAQEQAPLYPVPDWPPEPTEIQLPAEMTADPAPASLGHLAHDQLSIDIRRVQLEHVQATDLPATTMLEPPRRPAAEVSLPPELPPAPHGANGSAGWPHIDLRPLSGAAPPAPAPAVPSAFDLTPWTGSNGRRQDAAPVLGAALGSGTGETVPEGSPTTRWRPRQRDGAPPPVVPGARVATPWPATSPEPVLAPPGTDRLKRIEPARVTPADEQFADGPFTAGQFADEPFTAGQFADTALDDGPFMGGTWPTDWQQLPTVTEMPVSRASVRAGRAARNGSARHRFR